MNHRIRNDSLIDIGLNVDTSDLEAKMDEIDARFDTLEDNLDHKVNEDSVGQAIDGYLDEHLQDRVDHAVEDSDLDRKISDVVDGMTIDVDTQIADYLDSNGFINEDRVEGKINDALQDYVTSVDVRDIVSEEAPGVSEDRVEEMINDAIEAADNKDIRDLERRLDLYAQKVDELRGKMADLEAQADNKDNLIGTLVKNLEILEAHVTNLENTSQDATTLLGLLRRAAEIILGH